MRTASILVTVVLVFSTVSQAHAWDERGHRVIALIANHYLEAPVRKQVEAMLTADEDPLALHDIAGAATWADRYRDSATPEHDKSTTNWHFAAIYANRPNIPEACFGQVPLPAGTPASKGSGYACIIDKIDQFRAELSNPSTDAAERLLALKYLLHLVGDIHAPLHVTDMHNQFGQVIQVAAQDNSITPGTLFGYWEQALVRRLGLHEQAVAQELIAGISPNEQDLWAGQVTHIWALESHQHGIEHAYGTMLSKFEDGRFVISPAELDRGRAIVTEQMSKAGVRLAGLLNAALAAQPASRVTSPVAGNVARGRAIAEAKCVVCHIIGGGVGEGPAYTTAPDFATVANTRNMSPIVLRSFLTGPHPTMPRLSLNEEQVRDIIAYIMSQHLAP